MCNDNEYNANIVWHMQMNPHQDCMYINRLFTDSSNIFNCKKSAEKMHFHFNVLYWIWMLIRFNVIKQDMLWGKKEQVINKKLT